MYGDQSGEFVCGSWDLKGSCFKPEYQNSNSHLLSLYTFNRSSGENLLKYQLDSSSVIMSLILMTTLFYICIDITWRNLMLITLRA